MSDFLVKCLFSRIFWPCILVFLIFLISCGAGEYDRRETVGVTSDGKGNGNDFRSCTEGKCIKRTSKQLTGMWFGPRLGKRRKFDYKVEPEADKVDIEAISDVFGNSRWTLILLPGEKGGAWHKSRSRTPEDPDEDEWEIYEKGQIPEGIEMEEEAQPLILASRLGRRLPWTTSVKHNSPLHATITRET